MSTDRPGCAVSAEPAGDPGAEERAVGRALGRAGLYRLLGAALSYPGPGRLEDLATLAQTAGAGCDGPAAIAEPLAAFAAAVRAADPAAVAAEHVFLFDREARCPPYEGAYGDGPRLAGKGAALADISGFYAAFGLGPSTARPEIEDHLACELEFMSALALREAYARSEGHAEGLEVTRQAQVKFLTDHLGCWAEAFAEALKAATPVPYYRALADLLAAWVAEEVRGRGAVPAVVGGRSGYDPVQEEAAFTCPMAAPEPEDPAARGDLA